MRCRRICATLTVTFADGLSQTVRLSAGEEKALNAE